MLSKTKLNEEVKSILEFCYRFPERPDYDIVNLQVAAFELRDRLEILSKRDNERLRQLSEEVQKLSERTEVLRKERELEKARLIIGDVSRISRPFEEPKSDSDEGRDSELDESIDNVHIPWQIQDQVYKLISDVDSISTILEKCDRSEYLNCQLLEDDLDELSRYLKENSKFIDVDDIDRRVEDLVESLEEIIVECNVEHYEEEQQVLKMTKAFDQLNQGNLLGDHATRSDLLATNRAIADLCSFIKIHRTDQVNMLEKMLEENLVSIKKMPEQPVSDDEEDDDLYSYDDPKGQMQHVFDMLGDIKGEFGRYHEISRSRYMVINYDFEALKSRRSQRKKPVDRVETND